MTFAPLLLRAPLLGAIFAALLLRPIPRGIDSVFQISDWIATALLACAWAWGVLSFGNIIRARIHSELPVFTSSFVLGVSTISLLAPLLILLQGAALLQGVFWLVIACGFVGVPEWRGRIKPAFSGWWIGLGFVLLNLVIMAMSPKYGSDPYRYHIPGPFYWIQNQTLAPWRGMPQMFHAGWPEYFFMAPIAYFSEASGKGLLEALSFVQVNTVLLGVAGFFGAGLAFSRNVFKSVDAVWFVVFTCQFLFVPFWGNTFVAKNDFLCIAMGVSGLALFFGPRRFWFLAGFAVGYAVATKLTYVTMTWVIAAAFAARLLRREHWRSVFDRDFLKLLAGFFLPVGLIFFRNKWFTGDWLFPINGGSQSPLFSESWKTMLLAYSDAFQAAPWMYIKERALDSLIDMSLPASVLITFLGHRALGLSLLLGTLMRIFFWNADMSSDAGIIGRYFMWVQPLAVIGAVSLLIDRFGFRVWLARKWVVIALVLAGTALGIYPYRYGLLFQRNEMVNFNMAFLKSTPGGASKEVTRRLNPQGAPILTTGDDWILALAPHSVYVGTLDPELDRLFSNPFNYPRKIRLLSQSGFRLILDSQHISNRPWARMSASVRVQSAQCPWSRFFIDAYGQVIGVRLLADCVAPYSTVNSRGLPYIWGGEL